MIVYRQIQTLAEDLGFETKTLYAVSYSRDKHYHKAKTLKSDGSYRFLSVPDEILKAIQRSIYTNLLVHMPISKYATAYRYGWNIKKNAEVHCGKKLVFKLDIQSFFDSILYATVKERVFPARIYAENLRVLLTMLCYDRDCLPQGAPTSPAIANIILKDFDIKLGAWCCERDIAYTRYCDDLTFSGDFEPSALYEYVRQSLYEEGFYINQRKTKLVDASHCQLVTGLVVNEKVSVPAAYRKKVRQELYYCKKYGIESHLERLGVPPTPEEYLQTLLGKINFILQYEDRDSALFSDRDWLLRELQNAAMVIE